MALLSTGNVLVLPFLFLFTVPIALVAALTTTIAFSILLFRVTLIYIELALAIIPNCILGPANPDLHRRALAGPKSPPARRHRRHPSSTAALSGTTTPTLFAGQQHVRDYEGVGGWHLGPPSDDDDLWTKMNSRLELPADHGRRHQRSLTSGSVPGSGAGQKRNMSMEMMSRARTPPSVTFTGDSFFPYVPPSSPGALRRSSSGLTGASASTASSKASSMLNMKQHK